MKYTHLEVTLITIKMHKYGGRFVRLLSKLISIADDKNKEKLINTFSDYFEKYFNMED